MADPYHMLHKGRMAQDEKLQRACALVRQAVGLCDEMKLPLPASYLHHGLELLEDVAQPHRIHELPQDFRPS
ncbi:hypothetical protein FHS95_002824 [Sphingomonas naasensis]|uniref:Uncharacterized protein n=1 Tax=Sphingomonas naasensis TaxID=1344951 RepID=A0A4S1W7E4_9SPHN|nr:hypothetical protein [Sphingomonas naasensis]NIJ21121.1 hypothetical protein [Sphingomonas naasensis]TGX38293.1 hypothetical protein E5A74_18915 [Sphingomonas naasensis]